MHSYAAAVLQQYIPLGVVSPGQHSYRLSNF